MPPRGVKKGTKRARQYEHIKQSEKQQGASESRAEEIAARTVNKERARSGESRMRSRTSTEDMSSSRRGGQRSGTNRPKGRTRDQLYNEAKQLGIEGRSSMNKDQRQRGIAGKKSDHAGPSSSRAPHAAGHPRGGGRVPRLRAVAGRHPGGSRRGHLARPGDVRGR